MLKWMMLVSIVVSSCKAAISPWPGEAFRDSTDLTSLNPIAWKTNLSGAFWNPISRRLWVADNSGTFSVLKEGGANGFEVERNYAPGGDLEAITQADPASERVYLISERLNQIQEYAIPTGALTQSWDITKLIGGMADRNDAAEGIAFISDKWLAASGFRGSNGELYPRSIYGAEGLGGVMLVSVQDVARATAGYVYAVDLKKDGTWTAVGKFKTSRKESCELSFDASIGRLYILHNIDGNILEITDLTSSAFGADRKFTTLHEIRVPSKSNIEGFAVTPALKSDKTVGDCWCFFTDDSNRNGALRWFRKLPSTLSIVEGNNQTTAVSSAVAIAPSVRVKDAFGNPLPNFAVSFSVVDGGGSLTGQNVATNALGIAAAGSWTLGPVPCENKLSVNAAGLSGSPLTFATTAVSLTISRVQIAFDFVKPANDAITISGVVPLPMEFAPGGKTVRVQVGSLDKSFVLTPNAKSADASFALHGKFTDGRGKFSLTLKRQDLFVPLEELGFSRFAEASAIKLPIRIVVDGQDHSAEPIVLYSVKARSESPLFGRARNQQSAGR